MKCCILHVLCEGPTEVAFVKKVLAPYLNGFSIYPKPISLCTSRKKNAYGGVTNYIKIVNDLNPIFASIKKSSNEIHIVTTMLDLYALPNDMPGYEDSQNIRNPYERVAALEADMASDICQRNFIPYIQLHEFEALLFSDITKLSAEYERVSKKILALKEETDKVSGGNPELINHGVNTAPSKRIIQCLAGEYRYDKVRSGAGIASLITLPVIMEKCRHFREWIAKITDLFNQLDS
ncbi:MAG: DUF4276 family protein [Bacteroides sp.]|nr:DUF4276 family protein [Bacteroides sp.]